MSIKYYENERIFKLDTSNSTYVLAVGEGGYVLGMYYGAHVDEHDLRYLYVREGHDSTVPLSASVPDWRFSPDTMQAEYPAYGSGDYRIPALKIKNADGNSVTDLRYLRHRIYAGKPSLRGMPATKADDGDADTLELVCRDVTGAEITLYYTAYKDHPIITRRARVTNTSDEAMYLERVYSASVDFTRDEYRLLHMWGCWGREKHVERRALGHGTTSISSTRGASGHYHNPFAALLSHDCTEETGEAYGFSLVYSGNFSIDVEVDAFGLTRIMCGVDPESFELKLEAGESFDTPEAVLVYSDCGEGGMSRALHRFWREHLLEKKWLEAPRPIVVNNWEATYFDFDADKIVSIAREAAELGLDMLVLDDGWFGVRNSDRCSLGDWVCNEEKLPGGIGRLAERVNALGVKLGLWFEPEMASRDSDLYRAHPDWCIQTKGRDMSIARHQYVLDLSRADVRDYIFDAMSKILSNAHVEYVKWDFNRNLTEYSSELLPKDRQGEVFHRYVLGLYELLDRITNAFPDVMMEGCASGGGRYDPAMLYYFPQYWTSDDTDPVERLKIQYGTSIAYPACTMSCHVSASPNHQTGRETMLSTRGAVAAAGVFGYELDPGKMTERERDEIKAQIADYRAVRHIVMEGDLYRLLLPGTETHGGEVCAWEYVMPDRSEALFTYVCVRTMIAPVSFVRLRGLDADRVYTDVKTGRRYRGGTLMNAGLNLTGSRRDGECVVMHLKAE